MLARQGNGKTEHTGEIIARGDELIEKIIPFKIDFNHEKVVLRFILRLFRFERNVKLLISFINFPLFYLALGLLLLLLVLF